MVVIREEKSDNRLIQLWSKGDIPVILFSDSSLIEPDKYLVTVSVYKDILAYLPDRVKLSLDEQRAKRSEASKLVIEYKFFNTWREAEDYYILKVAEICKKDLEPIRRGKTFPSDLKLKKS